MSGRSYDAMKGKNGNRRRGASAPEGAEWRGFADIPLNDLQKEQVRSLASQDALDTWSLLEYAVGAGRKVSIRADSAHSCWIVSVTGVLDADENQGLTLTARGPDLVTALAAWYYKAYVIAEQGSWESAGTLQADGGQIQ